MTQYEREEQQLEKDLRDGKISQAEFNKQARDMERDYRAELRGTAEEAAERAYNDVMGGW
jgi:hypothetical protein